MKHFIKSVIAKFFGSIQKNYDCYKVRRKWSQRNPHNYTVCANRKNEVLFPIDKVRVGNYTYGPLRVMSYGISDGCLYIGNFCSIARDVCFLLGGEHDYRNMSTYPFKHFFRGESEAMSKGDIIVEDDVWIGHGATIVSGVVLSRGTVVAAGSVVVKSTEPYSIVGGNPARLIKKRFPESVICKLEKIPFEKWDREYIINNMDEIYRRY